MRVAFLTFESLLTIFWFWAAIGTFSLMGRSPTSDWGTIVGGCLFLAFGIGTGVMLAREIIVILRPPTRTLPANQHATQLPAQVARRTAGTEE